MSTSQRWSLGAERPTGWPRINYNLHYQDNAKNECARMTRWRWVKLDECEGAGWRLLMAPFLALQSFGPTFLSLFFFFGRFFFCFQGLSHLLARYHSWNLGGGSLFLFVSSIIRVISRKWRELKAKSTVSYRFGWVKLQTAVAGLV